MYSIYIFIFKYLFAGLIIYTIFKFFRNNGSRKKPTDFLEHGRTAFINYTYKCFKKIDQKINDYWLKCA